MLLIESQCSIARRSKASELVHMHWLKQRGLQLQVLQHRWCVTN